MEKKLKENQQITVRVKHDRVGETTQQFTLTSWGRVFMQRLAVGGLTESDYTDLGNLNCDSAGFECFVRGLLAAWKLAGVCTDCAILPPVEK